jgi:hypothetical protein
MPAAGEFVFLNERDSLEPSGGARRDRTDDLLLAKQALSQLSYGPAPVGIGKSELTDLPSRSSRAARAKAGGPGKT